MPQPALNPTEVRAASIARAVELKPAFRSRNLSDPAGLAFTHALNQAVKTRPSTRRADNNAVQISEPAAQPRTSESGTAPAPRDTKATDSQAAGTSDAESTPPETAPDTTASAPKPKKTDQAQGSSDEKPPDQSTGDDAQISSENAQSLQSAAAGNDAGIVLQQVVVPPNADVQTRNIAPAQSPAPQPVDADLPAPSGTSPAPIGISTNIPRSNTGATQVKPIDPLSQIDEVNAPPPAPVQSNVEPKPAPVQANASVDGENAASDAAPAQSRTAAAADGPQQPSDARPAVHVSDVLNALAAGQTAGSEADGPDTPAERDQSGSPRPRAPIAIQSSSDDATPATARAVQVDAAVRLENATGSAPAAAASTPTHLESTPGPLQLAGAVRSAALAGSNVASHQPSGSAAAAAAALEDPQFSSGIVRGLTALMNQRGGVLSMRLDPPELGTLRVQMTISRGVVSAQFDAGSIGAQNLLERNMGALRNSLEAHGLTVDRLTVHAAPQVNAATQRDGADDQRHAEHRESDADADAGGRQSRGRRDGGGEQFQDGPGGRSAWRETLSRRFDPFGLVKK